MIVTEFGLMTNANAWPPKMKVDQNVCSHHSDNCPIMCELQSHELLFICEEEPVARSAIGGILAIWHRGKDVISTLAQSLCSVQQAHPSSHCNSRDWRQKRISSTVPTRASTRDHCHCKPYAQSHAKPCRSLGLKPSLPWFSLREPRWRMRVPRQPRRQPRWGCKKDCSLG